MSERANGPRQLPLVLPHEAARGREDFLHGSSNEAAFRFIDSWPNWAAPVAILAGPVGVGKTHLVHVWHEVSGCAVIGASDLTGDKVSELVEAGAVAVEDAHEGLDENALFHLLNAARERGALVLVTARTWPRSWGLTLPDLASRLRAATPIEMAEPDDDLLRRVLVKLFADRQVFVDPAVIEFLAVRMERSIAAAQVLVDALDRAALSVGRRITRPLAAEVLEAMEGESRHG